MRIFQWLAATGLVALVAAGCRTPQPAGEPDAAASPRPVATLREVMYSIIEDSAFRIFDAAVVTISSNGITEKRPTTDEEWDDVLHGALALAEAPNLIVNVGDDGRTIAFPQDMDRAAVGELSPNQIQARINEKRDLWVKYSADLQRVARETMDIVKKKDVQGLFDVGGRINEVCEACHAEFWFPDSAPQP